jgi:MFS transporter, DHA3 family, macrolide efflux protein
MIALLTSQMKYRNLVISYSLSVLIDALIFMSMLKYIEMNGVNSSHFTWFYIAYYLPAALFALVIGAWIEKQILQKIMRNSIWMRIILLASFIIVFPYLPYWSVFVFIFLEATIAIFYLPANDALVPRIVEKKDRAEANGMIKLLFVLMHIIGYVAAAFLIQNDISLTAIFIFAIMGLLLCLRQLSKVTPLLKGEAEHDKPLKELTLEGLKYILSKNIVKKVFIMFGFAWVVASSIDIVIIQYLAEVAHTGTEMLGIIGVGTFSGIIVGAVVSPYLYEKMNLKWLFILPLFVYALTVESMSMFQNWILIIPFFFIGGITLGIYEVIFTTYLQDNVSESYFARVFSVYNMILNSMPLPGLLFLGVAMNKIGIFPTIHVISVFLAILGFSSIFFLSGFQKNEIGANQSPRVVKN